MNRKNTAARFWQYIAECARLLYWSYFKPYTLERWLQEIHPELKRDRNPFALRAEFASNRRLHRYADQVWWLSATLIPLVLLVIGLLFSLVVRETFDWPRSTLLLLVWFVGLLLARLNVKKLESWSKQALWILSGSLVVLVVSSDITNKQLTNTINSTLIFSRPMLALFFAILFVGIIFSLDFLEIFILSSFLTILFTWFLIFRKNFAILAEKEPIIKVIFIGFILLGLNIILWPITLFISVIISTLRFYLWLPEFLWTIALFQLSRFRRSASALLRYLPPYFDELISLPLPFMDRLIADAYRENRAAARQTIDYLIASTNQQRAAARAMTLIAVDSLSSCQTLGDIVAIAEQLAWFPSPPPAQLGPILPQFLEISQSVRSAADATSAYRKIELLNSPIAALKRLAYSSAFSKNADLAARSGSIAQRWQATLEAARRTLEEESRYSQEIPPAYISGPSLDPETAKKRFKGRQDIFREIETVALSPQPPVLLLYGGRRTGKTSALKYLPEKVGGELVPLLVDMQGGATATTLRSLARYLAEQIIEAALRSRNLELPYPNKRDLDEDPFPALQRWLQEVEQRAPGKRFLLCLDEFERLSEVVRETKSRSPLNFLRHVMQHRQQWILLFSGSHTLDELDDYWSDYLINTQSLRLTYLQEEEARELIVAPVEDFPDIYQPEAVARIVELTRCQPYLVQLLCSTLVEELNRKAAGADPRATKATAADVEAIVPKALETGGMYFKNLWDTLGDQERQAIARLLRGEPATPEDSSAWRKLEQKEVLEIAATGEASATEARSFQVPLVRRYIEKAIEEM
ncbi:MAG: AAA family ATPase [Oscillatoria sp. SIO1A7]|nr:AAA family ATPase [Oscillatoria sp. SIO1A7]